MAEQLSVLLVEDSPTDALIVKHALRRHFDVEHVRTPAEAQELLAKRSFAVMLTDYCLPGLDGLGLQRWVVEQGLDVPVVVMSGRGDERVAAEALKLGAYDYIVKTEDSLASLSVTLQQVMRRHRLEHHAQILQQIVENASDVIITMRSDGQVLTANRALESIFGYAPEAVVGKPLTVLFPESAGDGGTAQMLAAGASGRTWQGELTAQRQDGTQFPTHMSCSVLRDAGGRARCLIGIARDITERRHFLDKLKHLSITDNLTGLYNHRFFHDRLQYEFVRARRYGNPLGCIILDVDFFKTVNDTYGHLTGDQVLKSLAGIITRATRAADIVARYGGEEFAILLPNTDAAGTLRCAEHVWESIGTTEIETRQGALRLTVSVGVASLVEDVKDEEELCRRADASLLAAKRRGRNNVCVWDQLAATEAASPAPALHGHNPEELRANLRRLMAPAKSHYIETVRPLLESLCQRNPDLQRRTANVTIFALELARAAGMSADEVEALHRAALFHAIARSNALAVPLDARAPVLSSRFLPEYATPAEKLIREMGVFEREMEYARHCTEWFDGTGAPDGQSGSVIPLGARILSIADAYHTLIAPPPTGFGLNDDAALIELRRRAGTRFDPHLVELFADIRTMAQKA